MTRTQAWWIALALCGAQHAAAQRTTLVIGGPGGTPQKLFEEKINPAFKAMTGADVTYIPGNSTDLLAKLQADRARQEMSVVMIDDGPMVQAIKEGFCAPLTPAPVYADIYESARFGTHAIGVGLTATGIAYNKATFAKNGWAPPKFWADLLDPKFKRRFTTSTLSATYGVHTLVMFSRIHGGSEKNIEPGFEAIEKKLLPNVASWSPSPAKLAEMFRDGEVDIAVWGSSRAYALKQSGFPVEFVVPRDGAVALFSAACVVAKGKAPELSQRFVQHLLSPQVQQWLTSEGRGPTNRKVRLDEVTARAVPYGPQAVQRLIRIDWNTVNERRGEWLERWNRTVDR